MARASVLICDHPWPGLDVERGILEGAGLDVIEAGPGDDLERLALGANAIMTCFAKVPAAVVAAPSELRVVARLGTGVDMIDCEAVRARGAVVTNVPEYCTDEVAEHALALALSCLREVVFSDRRVRAGTWALDAAHRPARVSGKTLGIVGFGKIGRAFALRAAALGMRVLVHSRRGPVPGIGEAGAAYVSLADLAAGSDVISLHVPLEPGTAGLVDDSFLAQTKQGAWLINTSRGALLDEDAVLRSLDGGRLAGVALDVLSAEPPDANPLATHPRVVVTPHVAFWSDEAVALMRRLACEDVVRVMNSDPPLRPVPG